MTATHTDAALPSEIQSRLAALDAEAAALDPHQFDGGDWRDKLDRLDAIAAEQRSLTAALPALFRILRRIEAEAVALRRELDRFQAADELLATDSRDYIVTGQHARPRASEVKRRDEALAVVAEQARNVARHYDALAAEAAALIAGGGSALTLKTALALSVQAGRRQAAE